MDSSRKTGPRVYFDAAVYLGWADAKNPPELEEFKGLVRRTNAKVVLSFGHLIDFGRGRSAVSQSRLDALLDDLPGKTFAAGNVRNDERQVLETFRMTGAEPPDLPDLRLEAFESIAQIRNGPLAFASGLLGALAQSVSVAENTARGARAKQDRKNANDVSAIMSSLFGDLEGFFGGYAEPAVAQWLAASVRAAVARNGGEPAELARAMLKGNGEVCDVSWASTAGGESMWRKAAARFAPGLFLDATLRGSRANDGHRTALASDLADRDHIALLPYVDVATVDKDNFQRIRSALSNAKIRRPCALFRNEEHAKAIAWLRERC